MRLGLETTVMVILQECDHRVSQIAGANIGDFMPVITEKPTTASRARGTLAQAAPEAADDDAMNRRTALLTSSLLSALVLIPALRVEAKGPKHKNHPHKGDGHPGGGPPGHARKYKYKVRKAPPDHRTEPPRPAAPSARHVWVPGYWSWNSTKHVWVAGLWSLPPQPNVAWVEPKWVNESGAWLFFEGSWSLSIR